MSEYRFFVRGEIDMASAPAFRDDLDEAIGATTDSVVLDCRGLMFIDSSGIAVVMAAQQTLEAQGRSLRVVNASDITVRLVSAISWTKR
jgi:anti-anti-sigma factor